ncbi:head maturation protease, ClpP-related [Streptomyces sp. VNUA74]|uniref:head maturation protease, ClpP-related n=1 Tax=Streptomyces sp. VNUA74 TaxID=3062685 RepID=UPI00280B8AC5|nr:head maturation protease, ClpP-related [Streptomyces sp. VNUA74]WML79174.1 Clp protease ClpP [Streptomyces sp. VNUA74]
MDKGYLKRLHQQVRPKNLRPRAASWYEIKNLSADTAEISLYDEVGLWGVTASAFADDLRGVTVKNITLRISSPGGDVFDGLAILNSLRQHPATVNVIVEGLAASAASFIAMAGDTVQVAPQAMFMIHDASAMCWGNAEDMTETAALLDKASNNIAAVYAQRAGGTVEGWRAAMKAETWYTDREAVEAGLADGVLGDDEEPDEDPEEQADEQKPAPAKASAPVGDDASLIDMPTPEQPKAAWDLDVIRAAITAAKEATTHG